MWAYVLAVALQLAAPMDVAEVAREAFELAADGRVGEARVRLTEAYEETQSPALLFVRGTFERDQDNCRLAIDYFERFLATQPPTEDADRARTEIGSCRELLETAAPAPEPAPAPRPEPPITATDPATHDGRPRASPWGPALVGTGGAVALVGGGFWLAATLGRRNATDADTEGDYDTRIGRLRGYHVAGIAVASVGLATAVAGAVVWAVTAPRSRASTARRAGCGPTVGGVACAF